LRPGEAPETSFMGWVIGPAGAWGQADAPGP